MGCRWCPVQLLVVWAVVFGRGSPEPAEHVFAIQHEKTQNCLRADGTQLTLVPCTDSSDATLWKWGSNHRLYNLGTQKCLGLDLRSPKPVKLVPCDSELMLFWRCDGAQIFGASMYRLAEEKGVVTANYSSQDVWRRKGSSGSICEVPYQVIYTTGGNSHGDRCEFPFFHDGQWHHTCVTDTNRTQQWCATTPDYTSDRKWGLCLQAVEDCGEGWVSNQTLQACYQFNTESTLKWKEAYESCLSQGADLLSISSEEELAFITSSETIPDTVWIGLNRFDRSGGWQWSDHTPLSFINWDQERTISSRLDDMDCGSLDSDTGLWQNQHCWFSLPYVCKKKINATVSELPDYWVYSETECDPNWIPYNGFCYALKEQNGWENADDSCKKDNGNLISLHSLADIEMVVTTFSNESGDMWSGFRSEGSPALFKWSDGEETHFTYWDVNEPNIFINGTPLCVSFSGNTGRWHVKLCDETLKYVCKKNGTIVNSTISNNPCLQFPTSRRHGDFCYSVEKDELPFGTKCNLTIMNKFEQEFINSIMKREKKIQGSHFWTGLMAKELSGDYFWQTTVGTKDLTFSNWKPFEPALPGGCVVMTMGEHFGKWAVKDCKTFKAPSICKVGIGPSKTEDLPEPSGSCAEGWYNGSASYCYKLFHSERLLRARTWEEAEGFCEEFGANLVSFSHEDEIKAFHAFLTSIVSDSRWIWTGLNKRSVDLQGSWEWSDGRPISSVMLPNEFQQEDYDLRDCVAMQIKQPTYGRFRGIYFMEKQKPLYAMKPFHCDATLEWVCQIPRGAVMKTPEWYQPDWRNTHQPSMVFEGKEYWIVSDKQLTYKEAVLYCEGNGSELAMLDVFGEVDAIKKKLMEEIGKTASLFKKWWVKPASFKSPTELLLHIYLRMPPFRDCSYISASSMYADNFIQVNCNQALPFICESKNASLLEINSTKTFRLNGSCPKEWSQFRDKCFFKIAKPKILTFGEAIDECKGYGGTLPTILSQTEQDFINHLFPDMTSQFWIGLQLSLEKGKNEWIDGKDTTYVNYHPVLQGRFKKLIIDHFNPEVGKQCFYVMNDPSSTFAGTWDFTSCAEKRTVTVCQKYRVSADIDGTAQPSQTVPENLEYNGYRYKVIQSNLTWYEALGKCSQYNMSLASITDQYQLSFLAVQVDILQQPIWIGLSSTDDGVHFRWQNRKQVTLNRWYEFDARVGDCVYMDVDGYWKTADCDTSLSGAVCYQPPAEMQKPAENHTPSCPHRINDVPWIPFQNSCYSFLVSHKRWISRDAHDANHVCRALNPDAYSLNIRDEAENVFVFNQLKPFRDLVKWVFLGIGFEETDKQLRWHDQTFVKYSNWREGRPELTNNSFYSAMSIDGFWDIYINPGAFEVLYLQQHSIVACKIELDTTEKFREELPEAIPYKEKVYRIIKKKKLTWYDAVRECKLFGGNLASVQSDQHQDFLEYLLRQDGFPLWIGLSVNNKETSVYEWSDGTPFDYLQTGFTKTASMGNCVFMDTKGSWQNKNCTDLLDGAVCYQQRNPQKLAAGYSICPRTPGSGEWIQQKGFCYAFDTKMYNFSIFTKDKADSICQTLDPTSSLLTLNDAEENDFVSKYLTTDPFITGKIWLGVALTSPSKESRSQESSPLGYSNWNSEPKGANGQCAVLQPSDGKWHVVSCTFGQARVVCKAPLRTSRAGLAIGIVVVVTLILLISLAYYCYKKRGSSLFSSVRYQRAEEDNDKASGWDVELL